MGKITIEQFLSRKMMLEFDKSLIINKYGEKLLPILAYYDNKTINNRMKNVYNFIKYDVDGDWLERLLLIQTDLKIDNSSLKSFNIRYGEKNGLRLFNEKNDKVRIDKNFFIRKYGEVDGIKYWLKHKDSLLSWGEKSYIKKYGEELGKIKWCNALTKKNNTMIERKKIKPYKNGRTLKEYQVRYGELNGYKLWDLRNKRQSFRFSEEYFTIKYGIELGLKYYNEYKISMIKTTLKSFIERYGEKIGTERYDSFINKIKFSSSEEFYIKKYGVIIGKLKYQEYINKKIVKFPGYSKISQILFWEIYNNLLDIHKNNVYFSELNGEFTFFVNEKWCKILSVDFKFGDKIIEFDGDYWHSKECQKDKDILRDKYLKSNGYKILRIKENEFNNDRVNIINKCLKFINNGL